jgi:predicted MFS family arabinose efflux permease
VSRAQSLPPPTADANDRALALLLGLHGLALMVVFPLGPQEARLWHPGVTGVAALASAFPLAAALGGLVARRIPRLPVDPRLLAGLALLTTLPCVLAAGYSSLLAARVLAGLATGVSYVAIHRALETSASPQVARLAPRIIAFGMPLCLLGAALFDWRAVFVPIIAGQAWLALRAPRFANTRPAAPHTSPREAAPGALVATAALASVSGAYLTVLSGFLVYNAGQTEFHIPAGLLIGAVLGFSAATALQKLSTRLAPGGVFTATLAGSALTLVALLALRGPLPGIVAVSLIGCFLAANGARHLALARLFGPRIRPSALPAHHTHTLLAHHLGSGIGALTGGQLVQITPGIGFTGMPGLLAFGLTATGAALVVGLATAAQPSASPAARAASANNR